MEYRAAENGIQYVSHTPAVRIVESRCPFKFPPFPFSLPSVKLACMKNTQKLESVPSSTFRRLIGPVLLISGVVAVAFVGGNFWESLAAWIERSGTAGLLVFFASFVVLTTFCFPVSVLGLSAGAMFGPITGLGLLLLSGETSGLVMFFVGRVLFRERVQRWVASKSKLAALDRLAEQRAVRLNFLARLSPLNYGVVCYTLASGKSSLKAYLLGLLAIVPGMGGQVWVGHFSATAGEAIQGEGKSPGEWALLALGLLFFVVLSWQVGRLVKQAWQEADALENLENNPPIADKD